MAALFAILLVAVGLILGGRREGAIVLTVIDLGLALVMLWHHATDKLKILL